MAIVVKGMSGASLLSLLEIPPEDVQWLGAQGFDVKVLATEVKFSNGVISTSVPAKLEHLQTLKQGTIGDIAKKALRMAVTGVIKQLKKKVDHNEAVGNTVTHGTVTGHAPAGAKPVLTPGPAGGIMEMLAQNKPPSPAPTPASPVKTCVEAFPTFPLDKLSTATPVPLPQASQLYQPVKGSSAGSRYFMVAANDELRIAARYKGESLSIRIEGVGFNANKERIAACGFTSLNKNYASMHLAVSDTVLAAKALGAVLLGLGVKLATPLPDLKLLHNKGA